MDFNAKLLDLGTFVSPHVTSKIQKVADSRNSLIHTYSVNGYTIINVCVRVSVSVLCK